MMVNHPLGFKVPKFVTVTLKPEGMDISNIITSCFMISDQGQALERDSVFGESPDPNQMRVKEAGLNDMMPNILQENKQVKDFVTDFFIVSLAHGQPAHGKDYAVLKVHEAPKNKPEFTGYLKKYKGLSSQHRFANFGLLMYIAGMMDVDMSLGIATAVAQEFPIDECVVELLEQV